MKDRSSVLSLLLLLLFTCAFFSESALAKSSSKKRVPAVTSLRSVHKIQPGKDHKASTVDSYRDEIIHLSSPSELKTRPSGKRSFRLRTASSLRRKLSSRSAIIMEGDSGRILYSHAPDRAAQPASTIKILTGLIAIQSLEDNDWVPASRRAASMPRSKIYLRRGKSYRANDMINAVLLSSANDASVALAEKIAGSERVFSKLMTHKARAWGATKTVCKTATGLTARGQKSTVRDLAILFNRAMDNPEFAHRVAKSKIRTGYGKLLRNHNRALWQIRGAEGGKTGFTNAARQTYVGQFKRGDDQLTVAILGSETMWDDIKQLVEYGFNRIRTGTASLDKVGSSNRSVSVDFGLDSGFHLNKQPFQILYDTKKVSLL